FAEHAGPAELVASAGVGGRSAETDAPARFAAAGEVAAGRRESPVMDSRLAEGCSRTAVAGLRRFRRGEHLGATRSSICESAGAGPARRRLRRAAARGGAARGRHAQADDRKRSIADWL